MCNFLARGSSSHRSALCVRCVHNIHHLARMSCFRKLLDPPLTSPSQGTPTSFSLLFPSHWPTTSTPQTGHLFGRLAEQSPCTTETRGSQTCVVLNWPAYLIFVCLWKMWCHSDTCSFVFIAKYKTTFQIWTRHLCTHTLYTERSDTHTHTAVVCGSSTRSIFHCKSLIGDRRKMTWRRESYNLLHQQRCRRSRRIYRSQEAEEGELSNSLGIWTKCRVLNSIVRGARTNFGRQRPSHHYVPVHAERMRRKSCQRKVETRIIRKTTYASKGI